MSPPPITIRQDASLADAADMMLEQNIGALPLVDDNGTFAGMLTARAFQIRTRRNPAGGDAGIPAAHASPVVFGGHCCSILGGEGA
jgi:CBS-domain-containing membrane protein